MHVLGTGVPRRLGVARSASSSKAAQALGCSLTPGLRVTFGRVTCMARAGSTYDFSSCFFPKFKKSTKRGFSREMTYFFGFYGTKIGGGSSYPNFVQKYQQPWNLAYFGVFLPALGWSCRTVLHTSVPAYGGFSTEIPIFIGFSGPKIGMGGFLPSELSPKPSETLEFGLFWSIFVCSGVVQQNSAAHQCTCIV